MRQRGTTSPCGVWALLRALLCWMRPRAALGRALLWALLCWMWPRVMWMRESRA
jgi:hypothetical protein